MNGAIVPSSEFLAFVERQSGQKILGCYQCGKCSAGCPAAYNMDLTPRQIMRAIQLGLKSEILRSSTIWVCVFCQTCSVRCPREIDITRIMESLRMLALAEETKPAVKEVKLFHRIFLNITQRFGRVYELGIGVLYNLESGHLLANVANLPAMLSKGKLKLLPPRAKGAGEIQAILTKVKAEEGL